MGRGLLLLPGTTWAQGGTWRCRPWAQSVRKSLPPPPVRPKSRPAVPGQGCALTQAVQNAVTAATQALQPFIHTRTQEHVTPVGTCSRTQPAVRGCPLQRDLRCGLPRRRPRAAKCCHPGTWAAATPEPLRVQPAFTYREGGPGPSPPVRHEQGYYGVGVPVGLRCLVGHGLGALTSVRGEAKQR